MRVLVTGGTGSIGSALVQELRRHGPREIRVLARFAGAVEGSPGVRFVRADVSEPTKLADAVNGVDVVFHLAALKDVAACEADPKAAVRTNVAHGAMCVPINRSTRRFVGCWATRRKNLPCAST